MPKYLPEDQRDRGAQVADPQRFLPDQAAIVGDPTAQRFATGRADADMRGVGSEMVRNRHKNSSAFRDRQD